jgi:hypothetical protein
MRVHRDIPEDGEVVIHFVIHRIVHDAIPRHQYLTLVQRPVVAEVPRDVFGDACEKPQSDGAHHVRFDCIWCSKAILFRLYRGGG